MLLENKEIVFQNGVKSIQAAAYNGVRMICFLLSNTQFIRNKMVQNSNFFYLYDFFQKLFSERKF